MLLFPKNGDTQINKTLEWRMLDYIMVVYRFIGTLSKS